MTQKIKTFLRTFGLRLRIGLNRLLKRLRRIKFRQVMGVIVIVKTFNPLLFLLALILFIFLLVDDIRVQLQPSLDIISTNYNAIVDQDLVLLQDSINTLRGAMQSLSSILTLLRDMVNGIIGFVNTIINAIAWFFGMNQINFNFDWVIPDFSFVFQPFNNLALHFKGLFEGIVSLFDAIQAVLVNLWERFKIFAILAVGWVLASIFATVYAEVARGLDLIRGPGWQAGGNTAGLLPPTRLDTPPVLIISQSMVTTPVLLGGPESNHAPRRTFVYQERRLLSALGIWPGRHAPLLYHQLVDQIDAGVWSVFWEGMNELGYDLSAVEMIVCAEPSAIASSVEKFLPQAHMAESIETQVLSALLNDDPASSPDNAHRSKEA
jgi:hypothetical protein